MRAFLEPMEELLPRLFHRSYERTGFHHAAVRKLEVVVVAAVADVQASRRRVVSDFGFRGTQVAGATMR